MTTATALITSALEKLGIVGAGGTPEAADAARALTSLKAYYQKLINSGAFGPPLVDIIPSTTTLDAAENTRYVHDGSVTVTLPDEYPASYQTTDYGWVSVGTDIGYTRAPIDLSVVSDVNTTSGVIKDYLYDNRVRRWIDVNALVTGDYAPLSHRDEDGLASALAVIVAPHFGQQPTQDVQLAKVRFEETITHNYSQAGQWQSNVDYF